MRAGDREGLTRLCRYGARPPFSLESLSLLPDGRLAYLLRRPGRNGATHLVMTPMQFLARISSLLPPPR
ncbi:transposase [Sorangium sp. So ce118]